MRRAPGATLGHVAWLESETPSDTELKTYLDEWCLWRQGPEPTPEGWLAVGEAWQLGVGELHEWTHDVLHRGLHRLNAVPRTDPFWRGTNIRPTASKLGRFAHTLLERDPDDVAALEALAALAVASCPTEFAADVWMRLWRLGALDARRAVLAALWCELNCGPALTDALTSDVVFLTACQAHLAPLEQAEHQEVRSFAARLRS